jgi:hypothetical protein
VLVVGVFAVSGCSFHPGSAAVVDGQSISQGDLDNLVMAACDFSKVRRLQAQGTAPATAMAYLRRIFLQDEISFIITAKAAQQLHLTITPASIANVTSGETIPAGLSSQDHDLLTMFFTDSARSQLQQATIGAHLSNPSVTDSSHVTPTDLRAAQKYMTAFTARQHVSINPAYGNWSGQRLGNAIDSLSVPVSHDAKHWATLRKNDASGVKGLPAGQVCG